MATREMGLYRGKRKDNGEWVEGFYVCTGQHHYIFTGVLDITGLFPTFERYEVAPDTVGECAYIPDKNGKMIFEGDIVNYTNSDGEKTLYLVYWGYHRWLCKMYGGYPVMPDDLDEYFCKDAEVIGNIHDNPELIGG